MKKLLFILSFLIAFSSYSQNNDGIEICLQYQKSLKSFISDKEAEDALNKILNVIGASRNFLLVSCDEISNALAITFKGERYILYDKDFIDKIEDMTNDWSGLFILAHEIGHHINGHTRDFLLAEVLDEQSKEKQREEELEADEFAGFIVANLGAKYNEVGKLLDLIGSDSDDSYSTHPNKDKRRAAVKKGFDKYQPKVIVTTSNNNTNIVKERRINASNAWTYEENFRKQNRINRERNELGRELTFFEKKDIDDTFKEYSIPDYEKTSYGTGYSYRNDETKITRLVVWQAKRGDKIEKLISLYDFGDMPDIVIKDNFDDYYDKQLEESGYIKVYTPIRVEFEYVIDDKYYGKLYGRLGGWDLWTPLGKSQDEKQRRKKELLEARKNTTKPLRYLFYETTQASVDLAIKLGVEPKKVNERVYVLLLPMSIGLELLSSPKGDQDFEKEEFIRKLKTGNKLYLRRTQIKSNYTNPSNSLLKTPYVYEFDLKGSSKALSFD